MNELQDYVGGKEIIPESVFLEAMHSGDLSRMGIAQTIIVDSPWQIGFSLSEFAKGQFAINYFVLCMKNYNLSSNDFHSRFEAARELVDLFETLANRKSKCVWSSDLLTLLINSITGAFVAGDNSLRNVIETGFLEHVFEVKSNRHYFSHWNCEPFADSYKASLKWGQAHPRA